MDKVTLAECPPGLFRFNDTLCFKSDYVSTLENPRRYLCDAYVVENGEYFYGGTGGDVAARSNLLVEPIATPAPDSEKLREAQEAFQALLDTHDEDQDMDDFPDDDSVGAYHSEDGKVCDLPLTFGILRRARRALAALGAS